MANRELGSPLLLQAGLARTLERIALDERTITESRIQKLLYTYPGILPLGEIEPRAADSVPVARELATDSGPVDLLFVNTEGVLTLVETKLWRNPEARRKVVGQLLDYAGRISCWDYDKLIREIRKAREAEKESETGLLDLLRRKDPKLDEPQFIDAVSDNLAKGRLLLLAVGDGIHEGVESMVEYLNRMPQLGFTLGLVELALFRAGDHPDDLLIQPRLVARSREVVRAIVEMRPGVKASDIAIVLPEPSGQSAESRTITEAGFFEDLAKAVSPIEVEAARWVLANAPDHSIRVKWNKSSFALYYDDQESDSSFSFGFVARNGEIPIWQIFDQCDRLGLSEAIWRRYYEDVVALVPGSRIAEFPRKGAKPYRQVVVGNEGQPSLKDLGARREQWFAAIDRCIARIAEATSQK